ncbi:unnamed protein product [Ambrosiozyma monospora]|uniref:Unnamed protein product n=1 Tax=Ambrosiozyma monospora TaxID=43982 RepID=A0ACB5SU72_AMBMO|nr:unnamed protein product [Ambrosiozyma monospora]
MAEPQYYYINGKISTCRRCKRKRTLDEDPDHLQFKTCYRCRMIERDQKKINQAKRKMAIDPAAIMSRRAAFEPEPSGYVEVAVGGSHYYNQATQVSSTTTMPVNGGSGTSTGVAGVAPGVIGVAPNGTTSIYGNTSNVVDMNANPNPSGTLDSLGVKPTSMNNDNNNSFGKPTDSALYNDQLYTFNILSIDPKLNPLTLPDEQQFLIQGNYLTKLHNDQQTIPQLPQLANGVFLSPTQCLSCLNNLKPPQLSTQMCNDCSHKESVIRDFNLYLTILKINSKIDLNKVIYMSNVSVDSLLKSSMSSDRSAKNIANKLYEKYVVPINMMTGAEFIYLDTPENSDTGVLKRFLRCVQDMVNSALVDLANIDPEALQLNGDLETQTQELFSKNSCSSLICISYDLNSGDLTMSFTHKAHR